MSQGGYQVGMSQGWVPGGCVTGLYQVGMSQGCVPGGYVMVGTCLSHLASTGHSKGKYVINQLHKDVAKNYCVLL